MTDRDSSMYIVQYIIQKLSYFQFWSVSICHGANIEAVFEICTNIYIRAITDYSFTVKQWML
jgi:hypothetical protein